MATPLVAIVVAAGRSLRMGTDKLWIDLWGRPAWRWSLDTLAALPGMGPMALVVVPPRWMASAAGDAVVSTAPGWG